MRSQSSALLLARSSTSLPCDPNVSCTAAFVVRPAQLDCRTIRGQRRGGGACAHVEIMTVVMSAVVVCRHQAGCGRGDDKGLRSNLAGIGGLPGPTLTMGRYGADQLRPSSELLTSIGVELKAFPRVVHCGPSALLQVRSKTEVYHNQRMVQRACQYHKKQIRRLRASW